MTVIARVHHSWQKTHFSLVVHVFWPLATLASRAKARQETFQESPITQASQQWADVWHRPPNVPLRRSNLRAAWPSQSWGILNQRTEEMWNLVGLWTFLADFGCKDLVLVNQQDLSQG